MPRKVEIAIPVDATPEQIWKVLTDAEELKKWIAPIVEVNPGKGGTMMISWGGGEEGTGVFDVWEPGEHLRSLWQPSKGTIKTLEAAGISGPMQMAIEWTIETKDGQTVLRLVHSGFGDEKEWDGEFNGTTVGWAIFIRSLRHIVSRHFGEPVIGLMHMVPTSGGKPELWSAVMSAKGLQKSGRLEGLKEGDRYSVITGAGDTMEGVVDMIDRSKGLILTVESLNNALFGFSIMEYQGMTMLNWGAIVTGMTAGEAENVKQHWAAFLNDLFGVPAAANA